MKIALDIDGPVAQFDKAFCEYYNMRWNLNDDYTKYDKWYIPSASQSKVTEEQSEQAFKEFTDIRMFAAIEATKDVKNALCTLQNIGCEIIYITARPKSAYRTTAKWLVKQGLPIDGILFANENKGTVAKALNCDLAIDDKPSNCHQFIRNGINTIFWGTKYNIDYQNKLTKEALKDGIKINKDIFIKRIEGWRKTIQFIRKLQCQKLNKK